MDAEFIIVDADDDRLSPFDQIVVLIKACCKNQRNRLDWRQRSAEIVADPVSDFAPLAKVAPWPVAALSRRSSSAIARRRQAAKMTGREANRLCQACNPRVQRMIRANLKTLEVQLAKRDREIREINATVRGSLLWRAVGAQDPGNTLNRSPLVRNG
jgi:hypothetical protein